MSEVRTSEGLFFTGLVRDISERKEAEQAAIKAKEAAQAASAHMDAILNTAVDAIITITHKGIIQSFNQMACRMFGYTESEVVGQNIKQLVDEAHRSHHDSYLEQYNRTGKASIIGSTRELVAVRANGEEFPIELSVSEVRTTEGLFYTGLVRDISERKKSDTRLRNKMAELEQTNSELDKFAYIASHDLKAPLRGIEHLVEWIEEDREDEEETKEHLTLMRQRITRMNKLLDDLLQYSRIGRKKMDSTEIDTAEVAQKLFEMASPPADFRFELVGDMPVMQTLDVPFELVLRNLLSNAIKHHDRQDGIISVAAKDDGDFYEFSVRDDGPGMEPEFHEKIFEVFQTLQSRDEVEGSGIGLALVKKTTQVYGGNVRVESDKGCGTCFYVRWPKTINNVEIEG